MSGVSAAGASAAPGEGMLEAGLGERVSDRVNPILVREIQQAMAGRTFLAVLTLSLFAVLMVALSASADDPSSRAQGLRTFVLAMQVLAPVVLLIVPLHAFASMRQEVAAGTVEHLLLSRLTPASIVRGKLAAASVQSLVFLTAFAPLIALTFLLRGVDVPTLAATLAVVFVYAIAAAAFGVAGGALSGTPAFRALPLLVVGLGLLFVTLAAVSSMGFSLPAFSRTLRRASDPWTLVGRVCVPAVFVTVLMAMVAASALAHPHENRSSGFRVFAVLGLAIAAAWVGWEADRDTGGTEPSKVAAVIADFVTVSALLLVPFWLWAVTEPAPLSPRVRAHAPRSPLLAVLATPALPGGGRGLMFTALLAMSAVVVGTVLAEVFGTGLAADQRRALHAAWAYVVLFASLAHLIRVAWPRLSCGVVRLVAIAAIVVVPLVPRAVRLFGDARPSDPWRATDVLDPFATLRHVQVSSSDGIVSALVAAAGLAFVLHAVSIGRGLLEVLRASAERRRRAA